jgi:hypothetical protein
VRSQGVRLPELEPLPKKYTSKHTQSGQPTEYASLAQKLHKIVGNSRLQSDEIRSSPNG